MNLKLQKTILKIAVIIFLFTPILMGNLALAHDPDAGGMDAFWKPGQPLVPCGQAQNFPGSPDNESVPCDKCQLLHLTKHLIDFILIAAAPILATFFFVVAGVYMMLGGSNPGMLSQGKRIFKDTMIGLVIVMLAWLVTNTLLKSLVSDTYVDPITGQTIQTFETGNWFTFSCTP